MVSLQATPPVYDLYAVANHSGGAFGGHYTATCRMDKGSWLCFDDAEVYLVDHDKIVSAEAYILFYKRREAILL